VTPPVTPPANDCGFACIGEPGECCCNTLCPF
jgi:hypothetical protein